jgi:hypothetical protein
MISRALLNAPFFIPKDADLLRNRKVNTKKRQNRHLPELAFLILGTYFTAPMNSFNTQTVFNYSIIVATRPDPTVRPPSRIANVRPCSIATG